MRAKDFISEMDRRGFLKGLAGTAAMAATGNAFAKHKPEQPQTQKSPNHPAPPPTKHKKEKPYEIWTISHNPENEELVHKVAHSSGIKDTELAQFLAQVRHESADFGSMNEWGGPEYFKHKYDIEYAPKTAKMLGNIYPGDGVRYHGRGFIQITGRTHYHNAGLALGLPLEQKPELANKPEVAAKIAVWYWKNHVRPRVLDFKNTDAVTELVNGKAKRGLRDRINSFKDYMEYIFFK